MHFANNQTMQGTVNGIENMLYCIGRGFYEHGRIIRLGIAVASLVYTAAGCTPNCERVARHVLREYSETGRTTPPPEGCYDVVNEQAYNKIRRWSEEKRQDEAERARFLSQACQAHVSKSERLEEACEEWKEERKDRQ